MRGICLISRDDVKNLFITLVYGGTKNGWEFRMLLKYKRWVKIPAKFKEKVELFAAAVGVIRSRCMELYELYAIQGKCRCVFINRNGEVSEIENGDLTGLMELRIPPKMAKEKESYV